MIQGISRIWESAKNVSLFGVQSSHQRDTDRTITIHATVNSESDTSLESDLDETPDMSTISEYCG